MYFTISFFTHRNSPIFAFLLPEASHGLVIFELMAGVEPATSSLPRMRSTTELHQQHELLFATTRIYECINKK